MSKRLVTIATFDQPTQARLAKNALEEAGIQATVTDESLVAMDWLLSTAIGGIKVQVWDEDADKAIGALEYKFGEHGEGLGVKVTPEDLAEQAEAAPPAEGEELPEAVPPGTPPETSSPHSERDEYARRTAFTALLGLMFPPISGYALYLSLNAAFGEGELSSRGRFNLSVGLLMVFSGLAWLPFYFAIILDL